MTRTPRALARRIDRLARYAHAFHRLAHHPLCNAYSGELIRLGARRRLCRGCAATALGAVVGTSVGAVSHYAPSLALTLIGCATVLGLMSLRVRIGKAYTRLLPAALATAGVASATRLACTGDRWAVFVVAIGVALGLLGFMTYRKRGPNRAACANCPQRLRTPCSGIAPMVLRERAFQRLAQRWLDELPK
jgi:hypothetical protein